MDSLTVQMFSPKPTFIEYLNITLCYIVLNPGARLSKEEARVPNKLSTEAYFEFLG